MTDQIISAGSAVVMVKTNGGAVEIVDDRERALPHDTSSSTSPTAAASAKSVITNNTSSKTPPTSPMSTSSSPSPSKGSSKSSSGSTKNSGSKSLSPWRTLQRLRKRKTNSNNDNENHQQRQQNQLSVPSPSSTSTVSSTQSVSVIRVPIKSSRQVANSRQKQKIPQAGGGGGGGTKSSNKDDTSGETVAETEELTMEIPEPPKIQNISMPNSLDPTVSTAGIATSQTITSNNRSSSSYESAPAVSPATTSTANKRTIESERDSIAVLRGNGMAIPMVRTKSIIKRPSNVSNSDDEEEDPLESKDDQNTSQRKTVSFCEKSLAEAERDSPSSRNRKRKLWDNIMLAMPVILPYLIAIIILIFACLVQPADQQHQQQQVHGGIHHVSSPSSTPLHGEQTEQQPSSSLSFIVTRKQSQRKSTNNISALPQVPDKDEDHQNDDDSITSVSGIWSGVFQNIFSGVVATKLVEIENANDGTTETTTKACETQDNSGGRWYCSMFSSFSTKQGHDDSVRSLHKQQIKDTLSDHHDGKNVGVKQRRNLFSRLWKKIRRVERS
mmetsp:Transcript_51506/g.124369  ORF Transcript_51506/g.124369 Transcript_51506/m.124369 type:complete len:555 (+) Transcript_51506:383-2047(+)